ncbi:hypothetical protein [Vibrio metoecus]|uniref:hypothetical protein n=1 Tax=Vibrio metoecus TaxID=1481663 RepID=UPI0006D84D7D|nr:hypothetical protein [Vibrio metoecus]KQA20631.1 hypothetical protein AAY52_02885 [Vibrio metoecus]
MKNTLKGIAILLALSAGFFANDLLTWLQQPQRNLSDYCLLSASDCQQAGVTMRLAQDKAHPLIANRLTVHWPNTNAQNLILTLEGLEMNMGSAKFSLSLTEEGTYVADIILPVCTADAMTWIGELSDGQQTVYPAMRMER